MGSHMLSAEGCRLMQRSQACGPCTCPSWRASSPHNTQPRGHPLLGHWKLVLGDTEESDCGARAREPGTCWVSCYHPRFQAFSPPLLKKLTLKTTQSSGCG